MVSVASRHRFGRRGVAAERGGARRTGSRIASAAEAGDGAGVVGGTGFSASGLEDGGSCDQRVCAGRDDIFGGPFIDAAVDLERDVAFRLVDAAPDGFDLGKLAGEESLAAEA